MQMARSKCLKGDPKVGYFEVDEFFGFRSFRF